MGKATLLTPVYFFSSMRAGSGKSTMLANLAIYLNNSNQKIAIVDLDADTPLKLKNAFPRSINLQEYSDISLISQKQDSRFQKNFYFTETTLISYFPAQQLKDVSLLFSDTSLRDFFIQITACFDTVMVNFPAGPQHSQQASRLLARQHLWRGKNPVSIIVSQSDEKSLISLDSLIQENPAFYYQLQENTLLLFNRVPTTVEDQKLAESTLNSLELRTLFNFPAIYVVGISEEFPCQRQTSAPQVLNQNSIISQTTASLYRMLTGTARSLSKALFEQTGDYQPCLDGQLLEKLSPYLEKIQTSSARKLLQHPSDIQVFLEENDGNYRIRIRLTGVRQPLSGIKRTIETRITWRSKDRLSPAMWAFRKNFDLPANERTIWKNDRPALSVKPIYRFDDQFADSLDCRLICELGFRPERGRYPSPILFRAILEMPDIPSLSEVLGYMRKQFRKCNYAPEQPATVPGVTHFFIPPEFELSSTTNLLSDTAYCARLKMIDKLVLQHTLEPSPAFILSERELFLLGSLPDAFARSMPTVAESLFKPELDCNITSRFISRKACLPQMHHSPALLNPGEYLMRKFETPEITRNDIAPVIYLSASAVVFVEHNQPKTRRDKAHDWRDAFPASNYHKKNNSFIENTRCELKFLNTSKSQSQENLYQFSFNGESKNYKSSPFEKTKTAIPTIFALSRAAPTQEQYVPFAEIKLPSVFKLADVMVDHFFPKTVFKLPYKSSHNSERSSRLYQCTHQTFFRQTHLEPAAAKMPQSLVLSRDNITHHFAAEGTDYYNLAYRISRSEPELRDQILKTVFTHKPAGDYRDIANISSTKTDLILDSLAKRRRLSPAKGKITDIRPVLGRPPAIGHLLNDRTLHPRVAITRQAQVFRHLSCLKQPHKFTAEVSPHLVQIHSEQALSDKLDSASLYQCTDMRIITSEAIFSSSDPELYTMPVRTATRQIYHSVSTSLDTRIDIDAMIESINFDYQRVYSELVQDPVFHCRIPAPPDFPLRNRKIELPQSLEYAKVAAESTLLDHENKIIFSADKRFSADQFYHSPVFAPVYGNIFMSRHSLPMPASKVWKKIDLNHKQFRINIPDGIETLYRHLLWTFSTKRQQPATFSSSSLVKVNKLPSAFSTGQPSFATTTSFRDRTRLITKLTQNFFRDSIKVSKLRMKDILSLARQASEKFSQVNNQLRA